MSDDPALGISPETHYFAYGTLLGLAAMRGYAPSATRDAVAQLAHHRLVFERYSNEAPEYGGCSLERRPGEVVNGAIYRISAADFESLDVAVRRAQGWFDRIPVTLVTTEGVVVTASTYLIPNSLERFAPSDDYVRDILPGARELGLPECYVDRLASIIAEHQALRAEG
ncbi:gamma-glutamylcyclotransferase [Dactylosporangium roseum]|uniref:Gamma-glutamylcyclotransferase n=1 Tax=Dactylosporangium roseum TaxID=47989 RepID=A0ABY5ZG10_9ACTN|nr:gamma-glutamylcyclotransferase family protein [Dactylosporangium roseum]UWZ39209.1 gamma-glutamylcyclotransferase [Dactylosporangium roseum]